MLKKITAFVLCALLCVATTLIPAAAVEFSNKTACSHPATYYTYSTTRTAVYPQGLRDYCCDFEYTCTGSCSLCPAVSVEVKYEHLYTHMWVSTYECVYCRYDQREYYGW